ncbi:MAG: hypothetical protein LUH03_06545 [Oscillospiraceae bacterium]|nr:hypothetical protein [Oscillospiraceae bacterium]
MRKVAIWIVAVAFVVLVIALGVMGLGIYEMDDGVIAVTAYIALPCIALIFGGLVYIRWGSAKCPHCGKPRWTNGKYCSYCGKEIPDKD